MDSYEVLTTTVGVFYKCTGETRVVDPDPLSEGFARYAESGMEHFVFEFFLNYVRRIKSDKDWRKLLKKNPKKPFLLFVTPSDIAHILALIKNGMGVWDQARRMDSREIEIVKEERRRRCHCSPREKARKERVEKLCGTMKV